MGKFLSWLQAWNKKKKQDAMIREEVDFVKSLARKILRETEYISTYHKTRIHTESLRRMCKYTLKTYPKIHHEDKRC